LSVTLSVGLGLGCCCGAALLVAASLAGGHAVLLGQLGCCYAGAAVAVLLRAA